MKRTESLLNGLVKKETVVFISGDFKHIELVETTTLFGFWNVREETREVYLPQITAKDKEKLKVIAEAYTELDKIIRRLKEYEQ